MAVPAALFAAGGPAVAHITLETAAAPAGSYYKAVFRVSHDRRPAPALRLEARP
jgi:uncharacterized protein YcnI